MLKPSDKFDKLSKLYKKRLITADQYEKEIPYVYVEAMERNLILRKISPYYDIDSKIETVYGTYSNVLNYHSKEGKALSLRVIKAKDEGLHEKEWENMKHQNIVNLLNRKSHEEDEAICYLSPYLQYTLKQVINSEEFKCSKRASMFLSKWLKDVASGLQYIHSKQFSHTNITVNNILIEDNRIAKITDFHFLNTSKKASNRVGLKYSHRPPEAFRNGDGASYVDCTKVDIWSLGILAMNIFTGLYLEKSLPDDVTYWSKDVYSPIFKVLKKKKFNQLHRKCLKNASESDILKSARSFAAFCFLFDPVERPTVKDLLRHDLLNKSGFLPKKDKMWHKKVHWQNIEKQISLLKGYEASYEDQDVEKISQVIDTKESPPNGLSGVERNMLILEDNTLYKKEGILEPFQKVNYTEKAEKNSEDDRLADLLISLSESHVYSTNDDKEKIEIVNENLKNQKETIISEISTTEVEDEIKSNIEIQDSKTDAVTEEIKMCSHQIQQITPEDKIKNNNTSVTDFHKENKAGKGRSYWNHEVGVYLLNCFIDNNSSNGMLHPENYLFKLVQRL